MSAFDDHYPDLLGPQAPPERRRLVSDLDQVCAVSRLPADRDAALAAALYERAAAKNRHALARRHAMPPTWLRHHGALAAGATLAAAIFLGGACAALRGQSSGIPARPLSPTMTRTAAASLGTSHANAPTARVTGIVASVTTDMPAPTGTPTATRASAFSPSPTS